MRFAWLTLWAFLRIATNSRVFERPLTIEEARAAVSAWLDCPAAGILEPSERYWEILQRLMRVGQTTGPLVMDAALAALAIAAPWWMRASGRWPAQEAQRLARQR